MLINLHLNRLNTINSNTDPRSVAKRAMATGHAMLINLHLNRLNTINSNTDPRSVAKRAMATGHAMLINLHLNRLNTINSNTDPRASILLAFAAEFFSFPKCLHEFYSLHDFFWICQALPRKPNGLPLNIIFSAQKRLETNYL